MKGQERRPVVIIIATQMTEEELKMIRSKGYQLVFLKKEITEEEMVIYDFPYEIDLNHVQEVFELISRLKERFDIMRIITFNEYYIALAAEISDEFGIKNNGLSLEAAMNCRFKHKAKKIFLENQVDTAKYQLIGSLGEGLSVLSSIDFPVVVKPSNDSGSHHVTICRSLQEAMEAVIAIYRVPTNYMGQSLDQEVIIEEYLEGCEYSIETMTLNGKSTMIAITAKETFNTIEIAHTVPAQLDALEEDKLIELVKKALKALKINNSMTHTEVKLTPSGPKIIEVNGRIGGDKIDEIVRMVTGIDLRKTAIHMHLEGEEAELSEGEVEAKSATVRFLIAPNEGILNIRLKEGIESKLRRMELYAENNQRVLKTSSNLDRLGYFIVEGTEDKYARDRAEEIMNTIVLEVNE